MEFKKELVNSYRDQVAKEKAKRIDPKITLILDKDVHEFLMEVAEKSNLSISHIIQVICRQYFTENSQPKINGPHHSESDSHGVC